MSARVVAVVVMVVVVVVIAGAARGADAETDLQPVATNVVVIEPDVTVDDGVPFVASELTAALRVRVAPDVRSPRVTVRALAGDRVAIEVADRTWELELEGRRGASAARLAAIAAIDLMLPEPAAHREPVATVTGTPTPMPSLKPVPDSPPARSVSVVGAASRWSGVLAGLAVDVVVPRGRWSLVGELGGGKLVSGDLHLAGAIGRFGIAARPSILELRIGVTLAPIVATDGAGDLTVLVGGNASARVRVPLGGARCGVLAGGLDVFATRTAYARAGMATVATPWFAPWFAVGVETSL